MSFMKGTGLCGWRISFVWGFERNYFDRNGENIIKLDDAFVQIAVMLNKLSSFKRNDGFWGAPTDLFEFAFPVEGFDCDEVEAIRDFANRVLRYYSEPGLAEEDTAALDERITALEHQIETKTLPFGKGKKRSEIKELNRRKKDIEKIMRLIS